MRLSPRDPNTGSWHNFAALAELGLGHYDAAIEEANTAIGLSGLPGLRAAGCRLRLRGQADRGESRPVGGASLEPNSQ